MFLILTQRTFWRFQPQTVFYWPPPSVSTEAGFHCEKRIPRRFLSAAARVRPGPAGLEGAAVSRLKKPT